MSDQTGEWLTVQRVAALLDVSEKTIRQRITAGTIPGSKEPMPNGGVQWRIPRDWVASQIESEVGSEAERKRVGAASEVSSVDQDDTIDVSEVASEVLRGRVGSASEVGSEGVSDNRLSRLEGYVARDVELLIGRAVEAAQKPLLEEIRALRAAQAEEMAALRAEIARLTESRQETAQTQPEVTPTTITDALTESLVPYLKQVEQVSQTVDQVQAENQRLKAELEDAQAKAVQAEATRRPWWKIW